MTYFATGFDPLRTLYRPGTAHNNVNTIFTSTMGHFATSPIRGGAGGDPMFAPPKWTRDWYSTYEAALEQAKDERFLGYVTCR